MTQKIPYQLKRRLSLGNRKETVTGNMHGHMDGQRSRKTLN